MSQGLITYITFPGIPFHLLTTSSDSFTSFSLSGAQNYDSRLSSRPIDAVDGPVDWHTAQVHKAASQKLSI